MLSKRLSMETVLDSLIYGGSPLNLTVDIRARRLQLEDT